MVQKRTLETRARLIDAANEIVAAGSFEALRIEDVVQRAGVAKGTFFAHFADKDALMDLLIGNRIDAHLDRIATGPAPTSVDDLVEILLPLFEFMSCERYVFDVILRLSGVAAIEDIGVIATTFARYSEVIAAWLAAGPFRRDVPPALLAEGVQAFAMQALALKFCALHNDAPAKERLQRYLAAWLMPAGAIS